MHSIKNFILFGASGNLAREKIYPALFELHKLNYRFEKYIGYGRSSINNKDFQDMVSTSTMTKEKAFSQRFLFTQGSYDSKGLTNLKKVVNKSPSIFYLSIPTNLKIIKSIVTGLLENDLVNDDSRIVVEKPIGNDYKSAKELISLLKNKVGEDQIYFIDHYLAKDVVRDITTLRFANPLFENLFNKENIERIKIETFEKEGIKDRGEFYDQTGAIRDMIQNHSLQMLTLVTMNQPPIFEYNKFVQEQINILKKIRPYNDKLKDSIKIGQYKNYYKEKHIPPSSKTETFADITVEIDTPRWKGVPMQMITGKKLKEKRTEIIIILKQNKRCPWTKNCEMIPANEIRLNIYPENTIHLKINSEFNPIKNIPKPIDFKLDLLEDKRKIREPYVNALIDVIDNEKFYMPSFDEILLSWQFIDKIMHYLNNNRTQILKKY